MPPKKQTQPAPDHEGGQSCNRDKPDNSTTPRIWRLRAIHEPEPVIPMHGPSGHRMTSADEPILLGGSLITPQNLSNYWHAMATCSDDVFKRLWDRCYIIEHRERTMPLQLLTQRVDGHLLRNGRAYCAPTRTCTQAPCRRCEEGRGGFRFPWCGYWTTDKCIGDRLLFEAEFALARARPAELAVASVGDEEAVEELSAEATMVQEMAAMRRSGV